MKNIVFPNALEKIGISAFYKTSLEYVELPASLREISQGAFAECKSLKVAKFGEGLKTLGTDEYPDDNKIYYGVFQGSGLE